MSHSIKMILVDYQSWVCGWKEVADNNNEIEPRDQLIIYDAKQ